jgi:hypothetical protein
LDKLSGFHIDPWAQHMLKLFGLYMENLQPIELDPWPCCRDLPGKLHRAGFDMLFRWNLCSLEGDAIVNMGDLPRLIVEDDASLVCSNLQTS